MNIWLTIYIALGALSVGVSLAAHGKPKKQTHNFWSSLMSWMLALFLLWMGGAFS